MLIGELSLRTGLSRDTIRYYEKNGILLGRKTKRTQNNYREYGEENVDLLELVKKAKSFGFRLKEIAIWIQDWKMGKIPIAKKIEIFEERIDLLHKKIQDLMEMKAALKTKLEEYKSKIK
jgi:MerR family transcriptional regulator, copper efflux regulator